MNNIKIKAILVLFVILSLLYIGNITYSKYKDKVNGTTNIQIASWNIIVNSESISGKQNLSSDIEPTFNGTAYINEGVLAPGAIGYYDIIIDGQNVDVSFNYIITATNSLESTINDLVVTGYTINPDINTTTINYANSITGIINYGEDPVTIRIYIKWDDSISASMNNEDDTNAIIDENAKALITNTIEFSQAQ